MIYDIGDTHLCDGSGPFYPNHDKLMALLDLVGNDDMIIGGDFLDLWRWSAKDILQGPNRDIIERVKQKKNVTIVIGNHDLDLKVMADIFQRNVFMSQIVEGWLCFHGHQVDSRLDTPRERKIVKEISLFIQRLDIKLLNRFRDWASSGPRSNGAYRNKFTGVKLLMHHTHVPEIRENYLNPGSWTGEKCHYITMDSDGPQLHEMGE